MKKYNTSGNVSDIFTVCGYSAAQTMVAVLKQCGDDLTRENVMKQAANIHDLSNFVNCICLMGAKSWALVDTVMPGSSIGSFLRIAWAANLGMA
jgi:hypothetical protein